MYSKLVPLLSLMCDAVYDWAFAGFPWYPGYRPPPPLIAGGRSAIVVLHIFVERQTRPSGERKNVTSHIHLNFQRSHFIYTTASVSP